MAEVFVVTGAAGGIGAALTSLLLSRGGRVLAADLRADGLEAAADREKWTRERVLLRPFDVSDAAAWEEALDAAEAAFGPVSVLYNVAGYLRPGAAHEVSVADVDLHLDVNVKGVVLGTRAAAKRMTARRSGHIVNMGSMASLAPVSGLTLYTASKFAVRGFSLAAAQELAPLGVAVTVVCPDAVATPMLDLQKKYKEAAVTFSAPSVLTAAQVAEALAGPVLRDRPLEVALPWSRGWLARLAGLFPGLAVLLKPHLERRGLAKQAAWVAPAGGRA